MHGGGGSFYLDNSAIDEPLNSTVRNDCPLNPFKPYSNPNTGPFYDSPLPVL